MSPEELIFSNCGAGEDFWKSLGQQVAYGMLSMEFTQNTGEGSLSFLQWIFPIQGLNPGLMHCRQILYQLSRGVTKSWTWLNDWTELNWTARSLNQSILKEINPGYSLEGVRLKLKLQYLGHLIRRTESLEKTLVPEKIEGKRRRGDRGWDGWVASLTPNRHEFEQTLGDSEGQGIWASCSPWDYKESNKTEGLNNNNLSPLNLVLLLVFCLFFFFWTYYSVASFYLICCFYSYVFGSLVTFPNLEEVPPCRRCFMCPRSTPDICSGSDPCVCCMGLYVWWVNYCGHPARCAWSLMQLVATPDLVWRFMLLLGSTGSQGCWLQSLRKFQC